MKKMKLAWLVIAATSVAVIVIVAYYFFGGKETQQAEHYWWQHDPEIVKVSERFKSMDPFADKMKEATLLFPVIKIGASSREVKALLGEPRIQPIPRKPDKHIWSYSFYDDSHAIFFTISDKGLVVDKGGA